MNQEHHNEQMEAVRKNFFEVFPTILKLAQELNPYIDRSFVEHIAWKSFTEFYNLINKTKSS